MNIILIGFASSGKSSAAQSLSEMTGWPHLDLDRLVEDHYEQKRGIKFSCRELFRKLGAESFADMENETLQSLSELDSAILSTGGRTPLSKENRKILKDLGAVVYLKTDISTILVRMKEKGFPSSIKGGEKGIETEWKRRVSVYCDLADFTICNDLLSPKETAASIINQLPGDVFPSSEKKEF
ncbi:MAG: shikimate kinase [Chitinispirillaceae bacterium]